MSKQQIYFFVLILFLGAVLYYILPPIFETDILQGCLLMLVYPVYTVAIGMIYTVKFGFRAEVPIGMALLFVPAVFLYFGMGNIFYPVIYAATSFVGCAIGSTINNNYNRR